MSLRAFFTTCGECGGEEPNHSGLCDGCKPLYPDPPFTDDVNPADPSRAPGGEGLAGD